jgi:DNA-binding transcriptional regulator YdaS (Cro superfamily)
MTGEQFAAALNQLFGDRGITERNNAFANLISCAPRTVRKWVLGELPVPRHIAMLVSLMIKHQVKPEEL